MSTKMKEVHFMTPHKLFPAPSLSFTTYADDAMGSVAVSPLLNLHRNSPSSLCTSFSTLLPRNPLRFFPLYPAPTQIAPLHSTAERLTSRSISPPSALQASTPFNSPSNFDSNALRNSLTEPFTCQAVGSEDSLLHSVPVVVAPSESAPLIPTSYESFSQESIPRLLVVDGCNVSRSACGPKRERVDCAGLLNALRWLIARDFETVAFLPIIYKNQNNVNVSHAFVLKRLHSLGVVAFTPARAAHSERRALVNYDDLYVAIMAERHGGCIVSGDRFLDLLQQEAYRDLHDVLRRRVNIRFSNIQQAFVEVGKDRLYRKKPSFQNGNLSEDDLFSCLHATKHSTDWERVRERRRAWTDEKRRSVLRVMDELMDEVAEREALHAVVITPANAMWRELTTEGRAQCRKTRERPRRNRNQPSRSERRDRSKELVGEHYSRGMKRKVFYGSHATARPLLDNVKTSPACRDPIDSDEKAMRPLPLALLDPAASSADPEFSDTAQQLMNLWLSPL